MRCLTSSCLLSVVFAKNFCNFFVFDKALFLNTESVNYANCRSYLQLHFSFWYCNWMGVMFCFWSYANRVGDYVGVYVFFLYDLLYSLRFSMLLVFVSLCHFLSFTEIHYTTKSQRTVWRLDLIASCICSLIGFVILLPLKMYTLMNLV